MEIFFYDKLAKARRCNLDDEACMEYIVTGLHAEDMGRSLSVREYDNPEELLRLRNTSSGYARNFLKYLVATFGAPRRLITDQGTAGTSRQFVQYCKSVNVIHVKNATGTPRANGQVERYNRMITPAFASLSKRSDGKDWDETLTQVQWGINNTLNRATEATPFSLLFNSALKHELDATVFKLREKPIENIRQDQEKQREHCNKKRVAAPVYKPGDMVLLEREPVATGESCKLCPKYRGPYIVVENLPHDRYKVQDLPETQRSQRFYEGIAAVDKMRRFVPCDDGSDDDQSPGSECEEDTQNAT
ncbi:hypothetical protein HPB47_017283 [Ixodes persulcatus]|uniref:Uncharacterized protein n=1 Tax=Ixodes persulcatus TaxID=34615 RepID=A0AC60QQP7_IXOPE|nr:hypothetical protein HPB47_017283 [Ixodes persulcatus]